MARLLGLADANNFFVSCERVFRPELERRPVVVLSNNDGCIIARSNEAKAMGIPMGAPMFQYEAFCKKHGVTVFSGNMALYRDMSSRVLKALRRFSDVVEPYSIDESFFNLSIASIEDPEDYCINIRRTILRSTGIPVSIGISTTKTLCKLGSEIAKEQGKRDPNATGVHFLSAMAVSVSFTRCRSRRYGASADAQRRPSRDLGSRPLSGCCKRTRTGYASTCLSVVCAPSASCAASPVFLSKKKSRRRNP